MGNLGNQPAGKREAMAIRRQRVLQLRVAGSSQRSIAEQLGVGTTTVRKDIMHELGQLATETHEQADKLRVLQHQRLEHVVVKATELLDSENEHTRLKACEQIRKTVETIARLYGLNIEQATVNVDARQVIYQAIPDDGAPRNNHNQGVAQATPIHQLESA